MLEGGIRRGDGRSTRGVARQSDSDYDVGQSVFNMQMMNNANAVPRGLSLLSHIAEICISSVYFVAHRRHSFNCNYTCRFQYKSPKFPLRYMPKRRRVMRTCLLSWAVLIHYRYIVYGCESRRWTTERLLVDLGKEPALRQSCIRPHIRWVEGDLLVVAEQAVLVLADLDRGAAELGDQDLVAGLHADGNAVA